VLTHEHWDRAAGIERGPYLRDYASKTVLTSAQIASLLNPPAPFYIVLGADSLPPHRKIDYEVTYPVGPGRSSRYGAGSLPRISVRVRPTGFGRGTTARRRSRLEYGQFDLGSQRPARTSEAMKDDRQQL
jgi:hypothetical protein